jgi:hypothetical protein
MGHPRPADRASGGLRRGEFFGTYLHSYLILRLSAVLEAAGQAECSRILTGHRGVLLLAAGRFLRPRRLHRRCSAPLPRVAGPGSRTGLDLRFLVAGPGFEPGKTVVGDFTSDRGRYRSDLGERQSNPSFWHAFDMTTPRTSHSPLRVRSPDRPATRSDSHAIGLVVRALRRWPGVAGIVPVAGEHE